MNYTISTAEQGSDQWKSERLGCVTGSMADIIYAKGKGKAESVQRINYRGALAEERITGQSHASDFMSKFMKEGIIKEPAARMMYEGISGIDCEQIGFLRLNDLAAGCSVDGCVRAGCRIIGIQEFKSPMLKTHIGYLKAGVLPSDYKYQVIHNLWCTSAEWLDFASYRPGFKMFLIRVYAKDLPIAEHDRKVREFLAEVDACEADIRSFAA